MTHIGPDRSRAMPRTNPDADQHAAAHVTPFSFPSAAWLLLGLLMLTFLEFRAVSLIQGQHLTDQIDAAQGILSGHPAWRIYQSRLLGPLLAEGLAHATHHPFASAYSLLTRALLLLSNAVCYGLFLRMAGSRRLAWGYTLAYATLFVALQDIKWLYLWDYVDLTTLLCFAFLVFTRPNLRLLSLLFVVELLNREAASFIGFWMMMEGVSVFQTGGRKRLTLNPLPLLLGGGLIAAGAVWTHWIRNRLCIAPTRPEPTNPLLGDQLWQVHSNVVSAHHFLGSGSGAFVIAIGTLVALLVQPSAVPAEKKVKIGVLLGLMLLSILLFGEIKETRVCFEFVPFGLFLFHFFSRRPSTVSEQGHEA